MMRILVFMIFTFLTGCSSNNDTFEDFEELRNSSYENWLPSYFPENAKNINIATNLDLNNVTINFELDTNSNNQFKKYLLNQNLKKANRYLLNKKIKTGISDWCISEIFDVGEKMNNSWMVLIEKSDNHYWLFNISKKDYDTYCLN